MTKHLLSILAFMAVSFAVQGGSHFAVNTDHYAGIDFMRAAPIMPMGLLAMVTQGVILTLALSRMAGAKATIKDGLMVSLAFGLFLASYIVLASPAKYAVPSIAAWMGVEGASSAIQFTVFGILLGFIHQKLSSHGH